MESNSTWIAADLMEEHVITASPDWSVAKLEGVLCKERLSGLPVVADEKLVGVVSRSDIIRQLTVERSRAGEISDYFRGYDCPEEQASSSLLQEEKFVASRLASQRVADVMSPPTFIASPTLAIADIAALLVQHRIHRVPIVDEGKLVGIISSLDIAGLVAGGTLALPLRAER